MNEELVCRIPSEEELNATYRGLDYEAFKALSEEELTALHEERRQKALVRITKDIEEAEKGNVGSVPRARGEDFWNLVKEQNIFLNFIRWRKYGMPDRDMTRDELTERTADVIRTRKQNDPNFGELKPREYRKLSPNQKNCVSWILSYLMRMRDPEEQFIIDDYSLFNTIGLNKRDVNSMLQHKVLQPLGAKGLAGNVYSLGTPYADHLLVRAFARTEQVSK